MIFAAFSALRGRHPAIEAFRQRPRSCIWKMRDTCASSLRPRSAAGDENCGIKRTDPPYAGYRRYWRRTWTGSPVFDQQSVHLSEMLVTGRQRQAILYRYGGNPDVVFWDWSAFQPKAVLDLAVVLRRHAVASEDSNRRSKLVESGKMLVGRPDFPSTVIKFPQHRAGQNDVGLGWRGSEPLGQRRTTQSPHWCQQTLPATRINLFATVLDRLLHGFQIPWIY